MWRLVNKISAIKRFILLRLAVLSLLFAGVSAAVSADTVFEQGELTLITSNGHTVLTVELADTYAKRRQGLMHRTYMPRDHGMLFIFGSERPLSFWMKDTPLSLDLIFFDGHGHYVSHHSNAEPNSLASIKSDAPAQFVLELNAGLADELGVGVGSKIHPYRSQ